MRARLISVLVACFVLAAAANGTAAAATAKPVVVNVTVKAGRLVGGVKRPSVKKGTTVKLVVLADVGESFHVHGYRVTKIVKIGKPTVLQFVAKIPGRFEVELHHPDIVLANLTVRP